MPINWANLQKKYKGLWIALEQDERTFIASGKTAKEAWNKARKEGYEKPILSRMPEKLVTYVGFSKLS